MQIIQTYSHLNGLELLEARKPLLLAEVRGIISAVDASRCKTKVSKEKTKLGRVLYAPKILNSEMMQGFKAADWKESRTSYWVCEDPKVNRRIVDMAPGAQKQEIIEAGFNPIPSFNQTDFVKERVAVEVQFGKYAFVAYDLFVKHLAFYVADRIDLGIEILPMKCLQEEMSSGPAYYEGQLYNLVRQGRGVPPVPLVLFGIAP